MGLAPLPEPPTPTPAPRMCMLACVHDHSMAGWHCHACFRDGRMSQAGLMGISSGVLMSLLSKRGFVSPVGLWVPEKKA